MAEDNNQEVSLETSVGKFKARGSDILTTVFGVTTMCGMTLIIYGGYQHTVEAKEDRTAFVQAIKENTAAQKQMVGAQRVANCLAALSLEQKKQQQLIDFCKSLENGR